MTDRERLRRRREALDVSLDLVARRMGITGSAPALSRWERELAVNLPKKKTPAEYRAALDAIAEEREAAK